MEDVMKRCPKCGSDVISGQRFCVSCGTEQELKVKTIEEITEMKKRMLELSKPKPSDKPDNKGIGTLMIRMTLWMSADMALSWVLGLADDKKLLDLVKGPK